MIQKTLVLIKPDGVKRNLIGEIISRYEKSGLKVVNLKMLMVHQEIVEKHYPSDQDYLISLGKKSATAAADTTMTDYLKQGQNIIDWLRIFISSGPVVAMILEGENGVALTRKVTGYTDPKVAEKGTIRGDLGEDSILKANKEGRPVYNLVHASGSLKEARSEIKLWFGSG